MKGFLQSILQEIWKKRVLGTSDAWSTIRLSHCPSNPPYYIVDWRISSTRGRHGKEDSNYWGSIRCMQWEHYEHFMQTSYTAHRESCQELGGWCARGWWWPVVWWRMQILRRYYVFHPGDSNLGFQYSRQFSRDFCQELPNADIINGLDLLYISSIFFL